MKECRMPKIMSYTVEARIASEITQEELKRAKTFDDFLSYMDKHFYRIKKVSQSGNMLKRIFLY